MEQELLQETVGQTVLTTHLDLYHYHYDELNVRIGRRQIFAYFARIERSDASSCQNPRTSLSKTTAWVWQPWLYQ